jgi:hypothetical protein
MTLDCKLSGVERVAMKLMAVHFEALVIFHRKLSAFALRQEFRAPGTPPYP